MLRWSKGSVEAPNDWSITVTQTILNDVQYVLVHSMTASRLLHPFDSSAPLNDARAEHDVHGNSASVTSNVGRIHYDSARDTWELDQALYNPPQGDDLE